MIPTFETAIQARVLCLGHASGTVAQFGTCTLFVAIPNIQTTELGNQRNASKIPTTEGKACVHLKLQLGPTAPGNMLRSLRGLSPPPLRRHTQHSSRQSFPVDTESKKAPPPPPRHAQKGSFGFPLGIFTRSDIFAHQIRIFGSIPHDNPHMLLLMV